jgi:hypothetical protein
MDETRSKSGSLYKVLGLESRCSSHGEGKEWSSKAVKGMQ